MKQKPFTQAQRKLLLKNYKHAQETGESGNPVVKLFCPWNSATWLISDYDGKDTMFGLCDLGHGYPEMGYVSLQELSSIKGPFGLTIERDLNFSATKSLAEYYNDAKESGRILA